MKSGAKKKGCHVVTFPFTVDDQRNSKQVTADVSYWRGEGCTDHVVDG